MAQRVLDHGGESLAFSFGERLRIARKIGGQRDRFLDGGSHGGSSEGGIKNHIAFLATVKRAKPR